MDCCISTPMIIETNRLKIRQAMPSDGDVDMFYRLWNHPGVMIRVGFPKGLGISKAEIRNIIINRRQTVFNSILVVIRKMDETPIGECYMGQPDLHGVSETDVKIFPEFWNHGYGTEIKEGLVNFLFSNKAECLAIKAEPHKANIGSQKMQRHVGAIRIRFGKEYPIPDIEQYFPDNDHYLYMIFRDTWEKTKVR